MCIVINAPRREGLEVHKGLYFPLQCSCRAICVDVPTTTANAAHATAAAGCKAGATTNTTRYIVKATII